MTDDELRNILKEEFPEEQLQEVERIIGKYRGRPGSLILVLEEVQAVTGYLPDLLQEWIARGLKLPPSHVFGVVTFYSFFTRVPKGKHQIRVCLGTACYVRGSKKILQRIQQELGISEGEVTKDRKFSLESLRCLGACGLAPVMVVGEDTHSQVKADALKAILSEYN